MPLLLDDSDDEEAKAGIEMRGKSLNGDSTAQTARKEANLIDLEHPPTIANPNDQYNQLPPSKDDSV